MDTQLAAVLLAGFAAVVLIFVVAYRARTATRPPARPAPDRPDQFVLKDGRDYRVDVDDEKFSLTNLRTGEVTRIDWSALTGVDIVAVDGFPAGDISYILHQDGGLLEVPLGTVGNEAFLATMQEKLDGFDNGALIEGMAMLQGRKQIWPAVADD